MPKDRKFTVGQRVWLFDENRRVYPRTPGFPSPIYAEHFREMKVLGMEGRSYLIGWPGDKISEKVSFAKAESLYYDDEGREDRIWLNSHRYKIVSLLERCQDAEVLRKAARLVGYEHA